MGRSSRPTPKHLAKKLRRIRDQLGLTQAVMCDKLGFPKIPGAYLCL